MERFWKKVNKTDGCWEWTAGVGVRGYGRFYFERKEEYSHRVSWMLANGPIPDGMLVCHHCDNRRCVRPDHLFLGTARDNTQDMLRKGRAYTGDHRGERNAQAKLSVDDVLEIRRTYKRGWGNSRALAAKFGVSPTMICAVAAGRNWKSVTSE